MRRRPPRSTLFPNTTLFRSPGVPRVQSEVFMPAGKTTDVMINAANTISTTALPIYDRELSLSGNAIARDTRSEEHTSELQSQSNIVCRLLLEKKINSQQYHV